MCSPVEVEILLRAPGLLDGVDPVLRVGVARLVLALLHAEHLELALVPAGDDVEAEAAVADVVGGDALLGGDDRMEQRRVHGAEHGDALGLGEQPGGPGHRLQRLAVQIGVAAVALPAADRQHEVDAGGVRHAGEREAVRPARRPALRHLGGRAAGRAVGAEQADLERVGVVHRQAVAHAMRWDGRARARLRLFRRQSIKIRANSPPSFRSAPKARTRNHGQLNHCRTPASALRRAGMDGEALSHSAARRQPPSRAGPARRNRSGRTRRPTISAARPPRCRA